jgi:predicted deacylase
MLNNPDTVTQPQDVLEIGGRAIGLGERVQLNLKVAKLYDHTEVVIPIEVIRGKKTGPVLFVSAAIHGDELNGIAICRKILEDKKLLKIHGTLIVIPVVNVYGFNSLSRYLPDRRDLNRCFPGSASGSLASRVAWVFLREIVKKSTHGIDLHTGSAHRYNIPQIRANTEDPATLKLAEAFGLSVIMRSDIRDGSLRQAGLEQGIPMLLFEGGEALRMDPAVIKAGYRGVMNVMRAIGMLKETAHDTHASRKFQVSPRSQWLRATKSGVLTPIIKCGERVVKGQKIATISDTYGRLAEEVLARSEGIVVGVLMLPVVHEGDALFHIAYFDDAELVESEISDFDAYDY